MKDNCRGCGEELEGSDLFDIEGYDGSFCSECQMEIERNEMDFVENYEYQ